MDALERLQKIDRKTEIKGWRIQMYFWTRSPKLLLLASATIIGLGACAAWFADFGGYREAPGASIGDPRTELAKPHPDTGRIIAMIGQEGMPPEEEADFEQWVAKSTLPAAEKTVLLTFAHDLQANMDEPSAEMLYYAHMAKPLPYANGVVAGYYNDAGRYDKAVIYYHREYDNSHSKAALAGLVDVLSRKRDMEALKKLDAEPDFLASLSFRQKIIILPSLRRWDLLLQPVIAWEESLLKPVPLTIAIVGGLTWLIIALQAVQPPSLFSFRIICPLLAVLSGMLSTVPTLFAVIWQEEMMGLKMSHDLKDYMMFFLVGVGPREELIKLLFFLPFVPVLLARKKPLEMLIVAGCVGLGFAIAENLLYFSQHGSPVAFGRFLTANFFHLCLTGLTGMAFCEMLMDPVRKTLPFLATLLALILAHGFYDALLPVVIWRFSISMIIFVLVALFFFRRLAVLRQNFTDQFSMAATLILGISLLSAVTLIAASMELGFAYATVCLVSSAIGMFMAVMMFYFQLTEGMQYTETTKAAPIDYSLI